MVSLTNRMHLRSGPVCGMQMMKDSKAQIISGSTMLQGSENMNTDMATNDSGAGLGGLVSMT